MFSDARRVLRRLVYSFMFHCDKMVIGHVLRRPGVFSDVKFNDCIYEGDKIGIGRVPRRPGVFPDAGRNVPLRQ